MAEVYFVLIAAGLVAGEDKDVEDCSNKEAYLCGSEGLIEASIKMLKDKGMSEDRIFYDKFT